MKIIIPMTGKSKRFKKSGIYIPKQFLTVGKKMIIEHIIEMFPGEKDINFIVSKEDLRNRDLQKFFKIISKYNFVEIDFQESGPGGAVLASKLLDTNEDILINYCDFSNIWNWNDFKNFIKIKQPDGIIPSYVGLHPHSVYGNDYAFLDNNDLDVLGVQEKNSFTDNKKNEFASTGSYYFKSGIIAKKYIEQTFKKENYVNNEVYISTPYQYMIEDGLDIKLYKVDYFFQWGTPEDYNEFLYNLDEIENIKSRDKISINDINLLIPAAGESSRFKKENYKESKIFLDIDGSTMLEKIVSTFENPKTTKILIQKKDYKKQFEGNKNIDVIQLETKTSGQAESGMKLVNTIENLDPVLIHSSDCILDKKTLIKIEKYDVIVFTKKNYRRGHFNFKHYGWVNSVENKVKSLSIKKRPMDINSNVIVGTFLFKNKNIYKELYLETLNNQKELSEVHIDHLVETALDKNMKVLEIASEQSIMIGVPEEYKLFKYMNHVYEYIRK